MKPKRVTCETDLGDWDYYDVDDMDEWLRDEVAPVLRENREVFKRAVDTMPPDPTGALELVIRQHVKRMQAIDALIKEIESEQ